jgi:hypothetical protein
VLVHGESGEQMEGTMLLQAAKNDPQGQGSAITYAKRYALMALCGLSADEDDDGNKASQPPRRRAASSAATGVITGAQQKRLFAIARDRKLDKDQVKDRIFQIAGVESSSAIPKDKYDAVIAALEAGDGLAA